MYVLIFVSSKVFALILRLEVPVFLSQNAQIEMQFAIEKHKCLSILSFSFAEFASGKMK